LELKAQFVAFRAKGQSYSNIARLLQVPEETLIDWALEMRDRIATQRAIELEAQYEKQLLTQAHRVSLLGNQLSAIQRQLRARNLDEVPTEKLLELQLEYLDRLRAESDEIHL
jgi:hypothetical protein